MADKWYLLFWLIASTGVLALRFGSGAFDTERDRLLLFLGYALLTWLPLLGTVFHQLRVLTARLERCHPEQWRAFQADSALREAIQFWRLLPFVYAAEDLQDAQVAGSKAKIKRLLRVTLLVFFAYPVFYLLLLL